MATLKGAILRLNRKVWTLRSKVNKYIYPQYAGEKTGISIISQNCIGGVLMHEYNMKFLSPTINCYMSMPDFVSFCENLPNNLKVDLQEEKNENNCAFPVARLDNLELMAVHYKTFEEFENAWNRRRERVNLKKVLLIMTDRDGFSEDLLPRIAKLPYQKVLFSHVLYPGYDFVCKIPGFEKADTVGSVTDFIGICGKRLYSYCNFRLFFDELMQRE